MPRNPSSFSSNAAKKAALVPLRIALGQAKTIAKNAGKAVLSTKKQQVKAAKAEVKRLNMMVKVFNAASAIHGKLSARVTAVEAIPVVALVVKPVKKNAAPATAAPVESKSRAKRVAVQASTT
jgi:hypothetical protein